MNQYTTNQPIESTCLNPLIPMYCKVCGSRFANYEQKHYDEYTGKKVFKWGCPEYGCKEHCDIIGGCIYVRKWYWGTELTCERCGYILNNP